jgi:hypothetical protein
MGREGGKEMSKKKRAGRPKGTIKTAPTKQVRVYVSTAQRIEVLPGKTVADKIEGLMPKDSPEAQSKTIVFDLPSKLGHALSRC